MAAAIPHPPSLFARIGKLFARIGKLFARIGKLKASDFYISSICGECMFCLMGALFAFLLCLLRLGDSDDDKERERERERELLRAQ
eukprot:4219984-Prymnesium_polylepis.1